MKKFIRWLDINLEPILLAVVFFLMAFIIVINVFLRMAGDLINQSLAFSWGEELSRYLFVWLCFLGISYSSRNNKHMDISYLRNALPESWRKVLMIVIDVLSLGLFIILTYYAYQNVMMVAHYGDKAVTLNISKNIVFASALVCYILTIVRTIQTMVWKISHFHCSYELFLNERGLYSGANELFFATARYKKELEGELDPKLIEEEKSRKARREKKES